MNQKGSAYLFVVGAVVILMVILSTSMKKSVDTGKKIHAISDHIYAMNARESCASAIFHTIKTWPFDKKPFQMSASSEVNLPQGKCSWKLIENPSDYVFTWEVKGTYKKLEKTFMLDIKGEKNQRGIFWKREVQEPEEQKK